MGILRALRGLFRHRRSQEESQPFVSIVLLLREPKELSEEVLRQAAERAWGLDFTREESGNFVTQAERFYLVKAGGVMLEVLISARPYGDDPEQAANSMTELRSRKAWSDHKAWMSVDHLAGDSHQSETIEQRFTFIGRLAAEMLDNNCTGVFIPWKDLLVPSDESLQDRLRTFSSLEELWRPDQPPVPVIDDDDPRLMAAVAEAKSRWPEFVDAFRKRKPKDPFLVKACFRDGANGEWMWVEVSSIDGDEVRGVLTNQPVNVRSVSEGDEVSVRASEISDWAYGCGRKRYGGFTLTLFE